MALYIRWLGAFRKDRNIPKGEAFSNSLEYEFFQRTREAACEKIKQDAIAQVYGAVIGIAFNKKAILRNFKSDVWSEISESGKIYPTRNDLASESIHSESFLRCLQEGDIKGIVIRRGEGWNIKMSFDIWQVLKAFVIKNNIKLFLLEEKNSKLKPTQVSAAWGYEEEE